MTPAPNPPPVAESVEQVDRDAAADLYARYHQDRGLGTEAMLREGRLDNHSFVKAFARHRAASHEAGRIAGVREAAKPAVENVWPMGYGVVATAVGQDDIAGKVLFVGVPDPSIGVAGNEFERDLFEQLWRSDAPRMILSFADVGAVDRFAATLDEVRTAIRALSKGEIDGE